LAQKPLAAWPVSIYLFISFPKLACQARPAHSAFRRSSAHSAPSSLFLLASSSRGRRLPSANTPPPYSPSATGHRLASHAPPLHPKRCRRPILSPPLPLPLPPFPPPLEMAPSIAAGQAPTRTGSAPLPRPYIKAPLAPPLITAPCGGLCSTPSCLLVPLL
jgi:hypothetical protein